MTCETKKVDSNIVGLSYAQESCLGILPDSAGGTAGDQAGGVWRVLEPNGYSDFGGAVTRVGRNPINSSRQRKKGVVTDVEASGGFDQDLTNTNLDRLFQGFFFADARERVSNKPINGTVASTVTVVSITGFTKVITLAAAEGAKFRVGTLVRLTGFVNDGNNLDVALVTAVTANTIALDTPVTMVDEVYSVGKLEIVGFRHPSNDLGIVYTSNTLTLTSVAGFTHQAYQVGEWIFIGGDLSIEQFSLGASGENAPGYARIEKVAANTLTLKEPTFTPLTNAGAGKTIRIFTGHYLRNEKTPSLIKRRSFQLERTLGSDANGTQSEVLIGCVPNELSLAIPSADKLVASLSFVSLTNELRDGTDGLKPGDRTNGLVNEEAYNTSSDIYQQRLFIYGTTPSPVSIYAYISEGNLMVKNNANTLKAIGVFGSFEVTTGDFEVSGSVDAYFATVAAVQAIKDNPDVGYNLIIAANNSGKVFDAPLVSLGGGRLTVEKDLPIKLPIETMAAENDNGYTLSLTSFSYLPNVAMASE